MKEGYFDRWRLTRKIVGIYEELKQLMLIENFQNSILEEIGIYPSKKGEGYTIWQSWLMNMP